MLTRLVRFTRESISYRLICSILCLSFIATTMPVSAQILPYMPPVGSMVAPSTQPHSLPYIVGMEFNSDNIFDFTFYFNRGNSPAEDKVLRANVQQASKYFLAALTIPEKDLWVNLSPYEQERIITPELSRTDLGKDLLGEDYVLKQLAASLTHPDSESGKKYWGGSTSSKSSTNSFQKVWIVPGDIQMKESPKGVVITKATLKVLTEEDYLAMQKNGVASKSVNPMRDTVVPVIEKEVNTGKHFAQLRQAYYSIIIAGWFKKKLKDTVLNQIYFNQKKTVGAENNDPALKEKIYNEYVQAFKQGVYKVIKTERSMSKISKRTYFSGGAFLPAAVTAANNAAPVTELARIQATQTAMRGEGGTPGMTAQMLGSAEGDGFDDVPTVVQKVTPELEAARRDRGIAIRDGDAVGELAAAKRIQELDQTEGDRVLRAMAEAKSNLTFANYGMADFRTARQAAEAINDPELKAEVIGKLDINEKVQNRMDAQALIGPLDNAKADAIWEAHRIGDGNIGQPEPAMLNGRPNPNAGKYLNGTYKEADIQAKLAILEKAGFDGVSRDATGKLRIVNGSTVDKLMRGDGAHKPATGNDSGPIRLTPLKGEPPRADAVTAARKAAVDKALEGVFQHGTFEDGENGFAEYAIKDFLMSRGIEELQAEKAAAEISRPIVLNVWRNARTDPTLTEGAIANMFDAAIVKYLDEHKPATGNDAPADSVAAKRREVITRVVSALLNETVHGGQNAVAEDVIAEFFMTQGVGEERARAAAKEMTMLMVDAISEDVRQNRNLTNEAIGIAVDAGITRYLLKEGVATDEAQQGGFDFNKVSSASKVDTVDGGFKANAIKATAYLATGKLTGFKLAIVALKY